MYFIILLTAVLIQVTVAVQINHIDEVVDGALYRRAFVSNLEDFDIPFTCPTNVLGNVCAGDCQTLLSCEPGSLEPVDCYNCTDGSPSTPYCTPGTNACTNVLDHQNPRCIAAQKPIFTCTSIGFFPDPLDCTLYHQCSKDFQDTFKCPPYHLFDVISKRCKLKTPFRRCYKIDCSNSLNQYVPYPGHKSYYAFCGPREITMYSCGKNFWFNPKTQICEFQCKTAGLFPNYKNCQQYYECSKSKGQCRGHRWFKSQLQTCPEFFLFDAKLQQCVERECVPTNIPTPPPEISTTYPDDGSTTTTTSTQIPPLDLYNLDTTDQCICIPREPIITTSTTESPPISFTSQNEYD